MTARVRPTAVLMLVAGFGAWAVAFAVMYGMQGLGCRLGWQHVTVFGALTAQRLVLVGLFLLLAAVGAVVYAALSRREATLGLSGTAEPRRFLHATARQAALFAFGATLFCFAGVFWLTPC